MVPYGHCTVWPAPCLHRKAQGSNAGAWSSHGSGRHLGQDPGRPVRNTEFLPSCLRTSRHFIKLQTPSGTLSLENLCLEKRALLWSSALDQPFTTASCEAGSWLCRPGQRGELSERCAEKTGERGDLKHSHRSAGNSVGGEPLPRASV